MYAYAPMKRGLTAVVVALALLPAVAHGAQGHPVAGRSVAGHPGGHSRPAREPSGTKEPKGHIAYIGNDGNLYVVNPDGTNKHPVTSDGSASSPYAQPTWSPSGTGILAIRTATSIQPQPSTGLWLVSPSGGAHQLTHDVPRAFAWAPDGHTIVYEAGYPPDTTSLVQLDTRGGGQHTVACAGTFILIGVTAVGNRAIGVQGGQIEAVALSNGASQALTSNGVWQNLAVMVPSGRTLLYVQTPGTHLVSLDLPTGHTTLTTNISAAAVGVAFAPNLRWVAYTAGAAPTLQSVLVRVGKAATPLRSDSYISPQAFAPDSSALTYTSGIGGSRAVFVASTGCPGSCARRLDGGQDAAWGP